MNPLGSRIGTPEFHTALVQGRILVEVAALQRGNLDTGFVVDRVRFVSGREVRLTARLPSGVRVELAGPAEDFSDSVRRLVQEQEAVGPPIMDPGPHRLPFQGSAIELFSELLYELGSNADTMVMYRPDIGPLSFSEIRTDGLTTTEIALTDSSQKMYRVRYSWTSADDSPIVGDLYSIVDVIADGNVACTFESPLEMRLP